MVTTVGYAGGQMLKPSYYKLGDHTECVDIYFDPNTTSYEMILNLFWKSHDPTVRTSSQYRSLILTHSQAQADQAAGSCLEQTKNQQKEILTKQQSFGTFFSAEEKHQKNQLRRHPALLNCFNWERSLSSSYVATRLNSYVGGHSTMASFNKEWVFLGLSKEMAGYVRNVIIKRS